MGLKVVHLLAFFALAYVGVEFTLAGMSSICPFSAVLIYFDLYLGWIVTFIIDKRHGGPSSGYISSGFFAGMTLGRVGLLWLNKLVCKFLLTCSWKMCLILLYRSENVVSFGYIFLFVLGLSTNFIFPNIHSHEETLVDLMSLSGLSLRWLEMELPSLSLGCFWDLSSQLLWIVLRSLSLTGSFRAQSVGLLG